MGFKIGVVGPLNVDLIMRGVAPTNINDLNSWSGPSDVYCITAGAAGYIAQNLKKLGNEIHLVSCIGDDPFGVMIKSSLEKTGIDPSHVIIEEGTKGAIAIFILLFGSNKRPLTFRLPTHHGWPPRFDDNLKSYLFDADLLHSAGYLHFPDLWTDDFLKLFKKAKAKGIITSMDPQFPLKPLDHPWIKALKPLIPYIDILMIDESEAKNITGKASIGEAANLLYEEGFKTIAIKLGPEGVMVKNDKITEWIQVIPPKEIIDTIGAGDSFDAGLLQGILEGRTLKDAALMGLKTASMSIEGVGGTNTFPTREELIL